MIRLNMKLMPPKMVQVDNDYLFISFRFETAQNFSVIFEPKFDVRIRNTQHEHVKYYEHVKYLNVKTSSHGGNVPTAVTCSRMNIK